MRKLATLCLVVAVCALVGIGAAAADDDESRRRQQSPESIVTCQGSAGGYVPINVTTSTELNLVDCTFVNRPPPLEGTTPVIPTCFSCVRSLEKQGCKVLDVEITNFPPASGGGGIPNWRPESGGSAGIPEFPVVIVEPRASFVLSCAKP